MLHKYPQVPHREPLHVPGGIDPDDFSDHEEGDMAIPESVDMSRSNPFSVAARAPSPVMKMEHFRYHLKRFVARTRMTEENQQCLKFTQYLDAVTRDLCYQIDGLVPMWKKERYLSVPRTWWDHLKHDLRYVLPKWAKTLWPVKYRVYDAEVILPAVPIAKPEHMEIHFATFTEAPDAKV